jgi:hypothetical protein
LVEFVSGLIIWALYHEAEMRFIQQHAHIRCYKKGRPISLGYNIFVWIRTMHSIVLWY